MTAKECISKFFSHKDCERLPCIEWATWWNLTLDRWYDEGLDKNLTDRELKMNFGLDYDAQIWISNGLGADCPKFKEQGYISNEKEYEKLRPYLYSRDYINSISEVLKRMCEYEQAGDITWFTLSGFFWFPRELFGIEDHLYSFYDYPELYHSICKDMTEYYSYIIEELTKIISPQFMTFGEDMSYNLGPMLSEEFFNEFIKPYYQQLIPLIKSKGIKCIVDSDGDVTKMIPWLISSGVDGILPLERQAGVDVNLLTEEYPDFFFIGGFDKMVMKYGQEAMINEFERILPAINRGNYLPSVDHQTPPDVSLDNYHIYLTLLKKYCRKYKGF